MSPRVVTFSPVAETVDVLRETLVEWAGLDTAGLDVAAWFFDDNASPASSEVLRDFVGRSGAEVLQIDGISPPFKRRILADGTHAWPEGSTERLAFIKDTAIERFLETSASHLFLGDIDLALHPQTLRHLLSLDLPVVSEVFWTRWKRGGPALPQVWVRHPYDLTVDFLRQLMVPGVYAVGGLCACTLIHRRVLESGVRFRSVPGLALWGEDRHFCVRASALGWPLAADTSFPPVHLYRPDYLPLLREWRASGYRRDVVIDSCGKDWEAEFNRQASPSIPSRIYRSLVRDLRGFGRAVRNRQARRADGVSSRHVGRVS